MTEETLRLPDAENTISEEDAEEPKEASTPKPEGDGYALDKYLDVTADEIHQAKDDKPFYATAGLEGDWVNAQTDINVGNWGRDFPDDDDFEFIELDDDDIF